MECFYDDTLAAPEIVELARKAERDGFDAVVISCFFDPGLRAAREVLSIPIASAGESSLLVACSLGHRIGIVTTVANSIPVIRDLVKILGLESQVGTVRAASVGVLELDKSEKTIQALLGETTRAIMEDKCDVIVLGCTGMAEVAADLQRRVLAAGYEVPMVDPLRAAIQWAEMLVNLKLKHSGIAYRKPPVKIRTS